MENSFLSFDNGRKKIFWKKINFNSHRLNSIEIFRFLFIPFCTQKYRNARTERYNLISQREYWFRWLIAPNCLMRCWFLYDFYQTEPIKHSIHSLIHVRETLEISLYMSQTHTVHTAQQCKCYGTVWNITIWYKRKEEEEEEKQRQTVGQKKNPL